MRLTTLFQRLQLFVSRSPSIRVVDTLIDTLRVSGTGPRGLRHFTTGDPQRSVSLAKCRPLSRPRRGVSAQAQPTRQWTFQLLRSYTRWLRRENQQTMHNSVTLVIGAGLVLSFLG
jgi:hypothetical protein